MLFRKNTRMADVVLSNYLLLPVLNRFGIQLGFGDKTVEEVCAVHSINTDFFLVIINSFNDHDYFPLEQLLNFPTALVIDYVRKSHSYYLTYKMPQIGRMIQVLSNGAEPEQRKQLKLIERFFTGYKAELVEHIQEEEDVVYPYALSIDSALIESRITPDIVESIRKNSIVDYAERHNNVEDKLYDLKNILIKYVIPARDSALSDALLVELFRLERDLNDHARIEDKVLFPKIKMIEASIKSVMK
jgi:regulator of cell morphogenesis and NO signaling